MSIVDLVQSVVLVVLLVFVVGLTRQIAFFIRPAPDKRADAYGPPVGATLSGDLFDLGETVALTELVDRSPSKQAALVVVNEQCDPCEDWLEMMTVGEKSLPIATLTKNPGPEFLARLESAADLVIKDDDRNRLKEANLIATPFAMVIDKNLRVEAKQLGGDPASILKLGPPSEIGAEHELAVVTVLPSLQEESR